MKIRWHDAVFSEGGIELGIQQSTVDANVVGDKEQLTP
jgi:hypothetical protein